MFCTKCGHKNDDGQQFCVNCGQPLMQSAAQPQQAYAPMARPVSPSRKRNIIIGVSAGVVVLAVVLLLVFLLPQNALVGTWYGDYGQKVNMGNGGNGNVQSEFMPEMKANFRYEITYEEPDYIEGIISVKDPTDGEEYEAEFWYEKFDGKEELSIEGEYYYRNKPDDWE